MTALSKQEIQDAILAAGSQKPGVGELAPDSAIEDAVHNWLLNLLTEGLWERWSCDNDECPARPEWDKRLAGLFEEVSESGIVQDCIDLVSARFATAITKFAAEYPDAPRRKVEVAA